MDEEPPAALFLFDGVVDHQHRLRQDVFVIDIRDDADNAARLAANLLSTVLSSPKE